MQFKVGDQVVHPAYGVGHIAKIEEKQLYGKGLRQFYKITLPRRSLWIPVEVGSAVRLRAVTTSRDLDRYRHLLKSHPVPLTKNHHHRHRELIRRLKQGSFHVICEVVRDLTAWGTRKPLGPTDRATLHKTREILQQEWAIAAGVSVAEATKEVDALLRAKS